LHSLESPGRAAISLLRRFPTRGSRGPSPGPSRRRGSGPLNWVLFASAITLISWEPLPGFGQDFVIGHLKVGDPRVAAPIEDESRALLLMSIHNNGDAPDMLVSVKSDRLGKAVLRVPSTRIVPPKGILIPPHAAVLLEPRRPLVMFQDIRSAISVDREQIKLVFERAGELTVEAIVEPTGSNRAREREATGAGENR
jgi:copper(I)-binding protein